MNLTFNNMVLIITIISSTMVEYSQNNENVNRNMGHTTTKLPIHPNVVYAAVYIPRSLFLYSEFNSIHYFVQIALLSWIKCM